MVNLNKGILLLLFLVIVLIQGVNSTTVASFTASPTTGVAPLTVQFTDTSTGNPTMWSWVFCKPAAFPSCKVINDYAQGPNPLVVFTHSGTYPILLESVNRPLEMAGSDKLSRSYATIVVTSPPTPISSFTSSPSSAATPTTIQFTDTSTGNPSKWSWSFGDGSDSTEQNPTHTYTSPCTQAVNGQYHVALTIWNHYSDDPSTTSQKDIIVISPDPVSSFTTSQTSGTAPLTVQFADTSSNNPTKWVWNFGDETTSNLKNPPSHTYTNPGNYTVTMLPSNSGCSQNYPATTRISVLSPIVTSTITSASPTISQTTTPTTTTATTAVPTITQTTAITTIPTSVPTTGQTTGITTVPTTSQTTITIATPTPTATVNYSATIAAMQSQIAEQNTKITEQGNILNQIMTFLRNVFGWK